MLLQLAFIAFVTAQVLVSCEAEAASFNMIQQQAAFSFNNKVQGQAYQTLEKMAKLADNRVRFY